MALTPAAMMNLRRGPTAGPTPTPGGAPAPPGVTGEGAPAAGMPSLPGAQSPGNMLMQAIAQKMSEQKKANANFASQTLDQVMRVVAAMQIHIGQMHSEAASDLHAAWGRLSSAKKKLAEAEKENAVPLGPSLGFSGAGITSQPSPIPGQGGGGMQGPT